MPKKNIQDLKATCQAVVAGVQSPCSWTWDDRFEAVLTQCDFEQSSLFHPLLKAHFPSVWTTLNCAGASSKVKEVVETFGGLQPSQELFLTDANLDEMAFGVAWWPWGGGQRVSLRFFLWPKPGLDSELNTELCLWFGIIKD